MIPVYTGDPSAPVAWLDEWRLAALETDASAPEWPLAQRGEQAYDRTQ